MDSNKTFDRFKNEKKILGAAIKIDEYYKIHIKNYGNYS